MFVKLLTRLLRGTKSAPPSAQATEAGIQAAYDRMSAGDRHGAIQAFRAYLETDPYNVAALSDLGACLADTGDTAGAERVFELAFSLDDSFMPVVVNQAKMLTDRRNSTEALPYLVQAKLSEPSFSHSDAVYANLSLNRGELAKARHFHLRAWLGSFDNLRLANGHLFTLAYDDVDERLLAAEHRFWAETVQPVLQDVERPAVPAADPAPVGRKLRIGYWSPDFRAHSVRFFARPLLENHDPERFDVFLYHDFPSGDEQTTHFEALGDNFHDTYPLSDVDFHDLVMSHRLDVFVELAGHTSQNRLPLMQMRFAPLQVTALGYPPTTGLSSIDAKLLDSHIATPDDARFYTEAPMVLPTSFWCFDPMEDAPMVDEPPVVRQGYLTFGCVGNVVKIGEPLLACWKQILERVPGSRLLLRAINFVDAVAEDVMRARLAAAGIDLDRVDLKKPEGGQAFYATYHEIDIVLDTFPFNGGTTTCLATYMGVPVISRAGDSLISRMGLSIMSNLDAAQWVATDAQGYVDRAVALASDTAALRSFKQQARQRYRSTALGNGELFAREFEAACVDFLGRLREGPLAYRTRVDVLPAGELVRRAFAVLRSGQVEAATRILDHCLAHHPDHGPAHLLIAQLKSSDQQFAVAVDYLTARLDTFSAVDRIGAELGLIRYALLMDQPQVAAQRLARIESTVDDPVDRMQARLYAACAAVADAPEDAPLTAAAVQTPPRRVKVVIPSDSHDLHERIRIQIASTCHVPPGWTVEYGACAENRRIQAYEAAMQAADTDIVVIVQKNVSVHHPDFFARIGAALQSVDVIGFAGAERWRRIDWRADDFPLKAAGLMVPQAERDDFVELQWSGPGDAALVDGMAVLDGGLIAASRAAVFGIAFDAELENVDYLLEEDWCHAAHRQGRRVAVHRGLGVMADPQVRRESRYGAAARVHLGEKLGLDPFAIVRDDYLILSAPVASPSAAIRVLDRCIGASERPPLTTST